MNSQTLTALKLAIVVAPDQVFEVFETEPTGQKETEDA